MKKTGIAHLCVHAVSIQEFLVHANKMIKKTLTEQGCISYRFFADINVPNSFTVIEEFENEAAIEAHNNSPHFKAFFQAVEPMLAEEPSVTFY